MNRSAKFFLLTFFFFQGLLHAQNDIQCIVTFKGNRIDTGLVQFKNSGKTPEVLNFKGKNDLAYKAYTPSEIDNFTIPSMKLKFISANVSYNIENIEWNSLAHYTDIKLAHKEEPRKTAVCFLKLLVAGKLELYYLYQDKKEIFFLKSQTDTLRELYQRNFILGTSTSDSRTVTEQGYRSLLFKLSTDCKQVNISSMTLAFRERDLVDFVTNYNNCSNSTTYIRQTLPRDNGFYVLAGLVRAQESTNTYTFQPQFGFGYEEAVQKYRNKFSMNFEMLFRQYKYNHFDTAQFYYIPGRNLYVTRTDYKQTGANLAINGIAKWSFSEKPVGPYIKFGFVLDYCFKCSENATYTLSNSEKIVTDNDIVLGRFGILLGLGYRYNKFFTELRATPPESSLFLGYRF